MQHLYVYALSKVLTLTTFMCTPRNINCLLRIYLFNLRFKPLTLKIVENYLNYKFQHWISRYCVPTLYIVSKQTVYERTIIQSLRNLINEPERSIFEYKGNILSNILCRDLDEKKKLQAEVTNEISELQSF